MDFRKAPLPKVVAVKVPRGTSVPGPDLASKLDGSDAVVTLAGMLERGEVRAAVAAAADCRVGNDGQLALMVELVGVAEQLPLSITIAIAQSIVIMDMEKARTALIAYRTEYPTDAHKLSRILAKRAPGVSLQLGKIFVPGIYSRPNRPATRAGSRLGVSASLVLMGIAGSRCAISTHHSYDYDYKIPNLDFKMPVMHLDPALLNLSKPPAIDVMASHLTYLAEIIKFAGEVMSDGTPSEVLAARDVRNAAVADDCGQLIDAVSALGDSTAKHSLVARSIEEIAVRLVLACPSR